MPRPPASRLSLFALPVVLVLALATLSGSSGAVPKDRSGTDPALQRISSSVVFRTWLADPSNAPAEMRERVDAIRALRDRAVARGSQAPDSATRGVSSFDRFNQDFLGLPQNEESIGVCRNRTNVVLGGTNDYRGLLDPQGNFTGWHFSYDNGQSLNNEGLLPPVRIAGGDAPSGGDPVNAVSGRNCRLYAASLNYDPADPFGAPNGIGVYRSSPQTLADCRGGADRSCWPDRRAVATNRPGHFLDKEWMTVGRSGSAGKVVWVTYSDFDFTASNDAGFTAQIFAVRCSANLNTCTNPILISGDDRDIQFSDVTIGKDGRTYVTWSEIEGEIEGTPQTFVHKLRVAAPGSTTFGPTRIVHREDQAIPFGGKLNANDFRVATIQKNSVAMVDGHPRVYVTWDACSFRVLGETVCEDAVVKLSWSDDLGRSWKGPIVVSVRGQNYFPTMDVDEGTDRILISYFTSRYDLGFDSRQDVELVTLDSWDPNRIVNRQRLTSPSNEPEADPLLGGRFIGDYIEVDAVKGRAYVHYNANYVQAPLLFEGRPVAQQDNFIARTRQ